MSKMLVDRAVVEQSLEPVAIEWQCVPVDLTADMRNAFHGVTDDDVVAKGAAGSRWAAMLAVAPQRPAEPVQDRLEQLRAFCKWERVNSPHPEGLPHVAEWAVMEIDRLRAAKVQPVQAPVKRSQDWHDGVIEGHLRERDHWLAQQAQPQESFDFLAHLRRQAEFSARTFGPGARVDGVTDHIAKELQEVRDSGGALAEWVDVIILGLDGAWRSGASPEQIVEALVAKQTKNEGRKWPDWRTAPEGKAIEHDRSQERPEAFDTLPDDYEVN